MQGQSEPRKQHTCALSLIKFHLRHDDTLRHRRLPPHKPAHFYVHFDLTVHLILRDGIALVYFSTMTPVVSFSPSSIWFAK